MDGSVRLRDLAADNLKTSYTIVYGFLTIYAAYQLLVYFDVPILSPAEIFWNALVYVIPMRLLLDPPKRQELQANDMLSQTHAAKGEALRRILGVGSGALANKLSGGEGILRRMSMRPADAPTTDAPPGLGNWDNSCYQNSVLQGLASVGTLRRYLEQLPVPLKDEDTTTSSTLRDTIAKLNDRYNNGKQLWTPAKLKSMSSWQQQDAQEYFSKIMDELDKDAAKLVPLERVSSGLEDAIQDHQTAEQPSETKEKEDGQAATPSRNPMEGFLAQRVACTRCGYSEGLSMIPFNCLTVPLGSDSIYDLRDCLDEYTKLEEITDVDCAKCTLAKVEAQLRQMLPVDGLQEAETEDQKPMDTKIMSLPPDIRVLVMKRLQAIQQALGNDDLSDKTLSDVCQIPKKAHVSSTKTRQAVIGRAPQTLVVHVNRSVFDELTGSQRKNYANVRYPLLLDLKTWMLDSGFSSGTAQNMLSGASDEDGCRYRLRAVVTHYGRHENGHYICYRRHPVLPLQEEDVDDAAKNKQEALHEKWWRLSDEDVSAVSEEDVLAQGGVFMLFYERDDRQEVRKTDGPEAEESACAAAVEITNTTTTLSEELVVSEETDRPTTIRTDTPTKTYVEHPQRHHSPPPGDLNSTGTTAEDESEATDVEEHIPVKPIPRLPSPSLLRTSRAQHASGNDSGFDKAFRAVAAT